VNKVYAIQCFKVLPGRSLYRPVEASSMIQFTDYTETQVVTNPPTTFPSYIYKLTSFNEIPGVVGKTEDFVGNHKVSLVYKLYIHVHDFLLKTHSKLDLSHQHILIYYVQMSLI
jgi:hypothetical protein